MIHLIIYALACLGGAMLLAVGGVLGIALLLTILSSYDRKPKSMKKLTTIIGLVAMCASVHAQDKTPWYKNIITFQQGVQEGKGLAVAIYPSYAPDVTVDGKRAPFGFGVAALYPVLSDHTFVGGRIDYLAGSFWAPSATVGAKGDFQLFGKNCTAYAIGGTVVPLAGAGQKNGDFGAIYGGFLNCNLITKGNFTFSAFGGGEKWSNLPGFILHVGLAATVGF